jgi:[acyl-carrier-protein] S-malonyltransferase
MKTLFLFPGQGAQYPGMGKDFFDASAEVRYLFGLASEASKIDLKKLIFEGTEDELKRTVNTQLSVALIDRASSSVLRSRGIIADGAAGFSLGEWPALVEAGVIDETALFKLLKIRGELMDAAVEKLGRPCGMSAILFLDPAIVVKSLEESGIPEIYAANYNSPVQVVISGTERSLGDAENLLKEKGAKKIVRLRVSGPFHSPLLEYARAGLSEAVENVSFVDPRIALYANATGKRVQTGLEAKELIVKQVTAAVRWTDEEVAMAVDGYGRTIEAGPGNVLQGLWKAAVKDIPCLGANTLDLIDSFGEKQA